MLTKKTLFGGDSDIDQLYRIFRTLGTPTEATWPGVSQLSGYKVSFPNFPPTDLAACCEGMPETGLDLLQVHRGVCRFLSRCILP